MEWAVVGVVVVVALAGLVIVRRRALEAEAHDRKAGTSTRPTAGRDDETTGDRE